jgi:hypothetical protein
MFILLVMGIAEFGMAFKDTLTIRHASVQGARGGATSGNDITADIQALSAIEEVLTSNTLEALVSVRISNPDSPFESTTYTYTGDETCAWSPCPDPYAGPDQYDAPYQAPIYLPENRDVSAPNPGRLQVSVTLTHQWVTGLFADTSRWTSDTVIRLEPRLFE